MSLVNVETRDEKKFQVCKIDLEKCLYFKTFFETEIGVPKGAVDNPIPVYCDGESFAFIVRLIVYGVDAVPNDSVPNHLKLIMFRDAHYIGLPLSYLAALSYCDGNIKMLVLTHIKPSNASDVRVSTFKLAENCINIKEARLFLKGYKKPNFPFNITVFWQGTQKVLLDQLSFCNGGVKEFKLDFLKGKFGISSDYRSVYIVHHYVDEISLHVEYSEVLSYPEFCAKIN